MSSGGIVVIGIARGGGVGRGRGAEKDDFGEGEGRVIVKRNGGL